MRCQRSAIRCYQRSFLFLSITGCYPPHVLPLYRASLALFPVSILSDISVLSTIMKSSLAPLLIGCAVLISPEAAHARTAIYVYRDPPTISPTLSPSISSQPSLRPSLQQESYLRSALEEPSSELWLIIYLTSALALLCLASVVAFLVSKKRNTSSPEAGAKAEAEEKQEAEVEAKEAEAEEEKKEVGSHTWLPSFWSNEHEHSSYESSWDESSGSGLGSKL